MSSERHVISYDYKQVCDLPPKYFITRVTSALLGIMTSRFQSSIPLKHLRALAPKTLLCNTFIGRFCAHC